MFCRSLPNKDENEYKYVPFDGIDTLWKTFKRQVNRLPHHNMLGSRDPSQEGAPYVWKTWSQVDEIVYDLARGYKTLNLLPETEGDGQKFAFMAIYAKNREEWILSDLATMCQSGTTIPLYDTLGPSAVEFVIKQTNLTSISCAGNYLRTLIMLKTQGRAPSLANLISFDTFDEDIKADAQKVGLNVYHIQTVIAAGRSSSLTKEDLVEP